MEELIKCIKDCKVCAEHLPLGPRPIIRIGKKSKVVIIGQAPGTKVHQSGIPWDDKSGENLRQWMQVSTEEFYNTDLFSIIPMGFCYPGKAKQGDKPPRKECAPLWHQVLLDELPHVEMILLIGKYAQDYYLKNMDRKNLTNRVMQFQDYLPEYFVLPHPSPLNNIWQSKNPWFKTEVKPVLAYEIDRLIR